MIQGQRPAPPVVLPPEVAALVAVRREAIAARVADLDPSRVLDLAQGSAAGLVLAAGSGATDLPDFDAIVSVVALPRFADVGLAALGMLRLLDPRGVLHLIEPVGHLGAIARARATWWASIAPWRESHLARDIPDVLRSNDLIITDLERLTMPTRTWPLRLFIDARARRGVRVDHRAENSDGRVLGREVSA